MSVNLSLQTFLNRHALVARSSRVGSVVLALQIYFEVKAKVKAAVLTHSFGPVTTLLQTFTNVAVERLVLSHSTSLELTLLVNAVRTFRIFRMVAEGVYILHVVFIDS
jgi:hypothetical protein